MARPKAILLATQLLPGGASPWAVAHRSLCSSSTISDLLASCSGICDKSQPVVQGWVHHPTWSASHMALHGAMHGEAACSISAATNAHGSLASSCSSPSATLGSHATQGAGGDCSIPGSEAASHQAYAPSHHTQAAQPHLLHRTSCLPLLASQPFPAAGLALLRARHLHSSAHHAALFPAPTSPQSSTASQPSSAAITTAPSANQPTAPASGGAAGAAAQAGQPEPSAGSSSWLMSALPPPARPYAALMRADKPIGTWLLLWPCLWSIALAAPPGHLPDLWTCALFSVGAVLLRGAGCTINDLWDRELDKKVARTATRPLASGALQPRHAVALLAGQLSLGLAILLQLNTFSQLLGASSLALVATYPAMKRVTYWPQAFLGLTFNWGALLGWAAVHGSLDLGVCGPLYASGVAWTLVYDTVYAHQDAKDDVAAGVKSTALLFGANTKPILAGFATAQVACLTAAGMAAGVAWPYYAGVGAAAAHLAWQLGTVDLSNGPDCAAKFASNSTLGGLVFAGCVAGRLLA